MNIKALVHILGQDYTVYMERDRRNCIDVAKKLMPDLILLDILMPEMSGLEVIKALKNDAVTRDIPTIL